MKKILVPTDFSDNAMNALRYAVDMAGADKEFVLLNAYHTPNAGTGGMLVSITDMLQEESERDMKALLKMVKEQFGEAFKVKGVSLHGELLEALERTIKMEEIQLVVMGTQGASGLKKVLIGSNTEKTIRELSVPVIAVPENGKYDGYNDIVFATDMKVINDARVMEPMLEVARKFNSRIYILYVIKEGAEPNIDDDIARLRLDTYFEGIEHSYHVVFNNDVEQGINTFIEEVNADLLAMIPRTVSFFDRLFKKSITQQFVYHTNTPLLAIHDHK